MATIGSTRGTNIPNLDNTTVSANDNFSIQQGNLNRGFKITPDSYTTIDELIKATKQDIMPDLVKTYGDQGLTGFLKLTGAVNNGGSSDQVEWWEEGRRHRALDTNQNLSGAGATLTATDSEIKANVQQNDVLMDPATGVRVVVQSGGFGTGSEANVVLKRLDGAAFSANDLRNSGKLVKIGNLYAQGTDQPTK